MKNLLPSLFAFFFTASLLAQSLSTDIPKRQYVTQRLGGDNIDFDGIPNEVAWDRVNWSGDFIQNQPNENVPPSQQSQFKILYSDKYLYIAYRCFDSAPDSIVERMSRRDEFPGDWMEVNIDSYHDLRTAFSFTFSVSGVKGDEFVSDNGSNWDDSWNPIWDGKGHVDSLGWTAEIKIPFSQLRYGNQADPVWGIQFTRRIFRKEERAIWQYVPRTTAGWVSNFGELRGLHDLPLHKQIELAPYVVAKTEHFAKEEGNPFADGSRNTVNVGVDGKVAVTSDLILDFTVNPDFGQVEADPGAVRLDGYEIFFGERRPFFVESRNLFDYQLTGSVAGGDYDSDLLFYSRRIGGTPHGYPDLAPGDFADVPQNTPILAAAKFSGKTKKGWSVGLLESVTKRGLARIDHNGERHSDLVEPLTNYAVGRIIKDFDQGNTIVGGIFTAVNRENGLDWLHRAAYSGGLDFQHFWNNRSWFVKANGLFSHVEGTPEAILATQTGFGHYFQRSNADYLSVDSSRTALSGLGGTVKIGKGGGAPDHRGGILKFETGVTFRSPQLELNDIGFLLSADEINYFGWTGYTVQKPFSIFREWSINYNHWARWDFGGQFLYSAFNTNTHAWFNNQWRMGAGLTWNPVEVSNNALRGGSSLRKPPGMGTWVNVQSDSRKKITASANFSYAWGFEHTVQSEDYSFGIGYQPLDALNINLEPGYSRSWRRQDQFVDEASFGNVPRTIVSAVEQRSFSLTTRLNYNITPDLTVQYYGQPFIFRARYHNYGYVADPLNAHYHQRFHQYTSAELAFTQENFTVDENHDGFPDYTVQKPDFNFIQFRSNLVVRWEYVPGSEVYLVWSQGAVPNNYDLATPFVRMLFEYAFSHKPQNIFLVKFTYRFLR